MQLVARTSKDRNDRFKRSTEMTFSRENLVSLPCKLSIGCFPWTSSLCLDEGSDVEFEMVAECFRRPR